MKYEGKRILLLDGYTSQCLEYAKALRKLGCHTTVLCDNRLDICYVSRYPEKKILGACSVNRLAESEAYIIKTIKSNKYDLVIPFAEYTATILSKHKSELNKYAMVIVNDKDVFEFSQDKLNVMKVCMDNNIPCPKTIFGCETLEDLTKEDIKYPIILKPKHGYGSRGFHKINNKDELTEIVKTREINLSEMVIQECIPKDSLVGSANIFVDKNGNVKSSFLYGCYRVFPIDGGSGVLNISFNDNEIHRNCTRLVKILNLRGPIGVDFMIDSRDGIAKILEVNLRPLACAKVGFLSGVNQAKQVVEDAFGENVTLYRKYKTGIRVRRSQIDVLWFIKSPDRFRAKPSWFSWKNTKDQLFSIKDPLPWLAFSINGLLHFKREMKARS